MRDHRNVTRNVTAFWVEPINRRRTCGCSGSACTGHGNFYAKYRTHVGDYNVTFAEREFDTLSLCASARVSQHSRDWIEPVQFPPPSIDAILAGMATTILAATVLQKGV